MTKSELAKMKKAELLTMAKKEGIKTSDAMSKEDLVKAISSSAKSAPVQKKAAATVKKPSSAKKAAPKKTAKAPAKEKPLAGAVKTPSLHEMNDTIYGETKKFEIEDKRGYREPSYELKGEKTYELPEEYGDTKITLLVQDPHWVHAYWEINAQTRKQYSIEKGKHQKDLVVRVYQPETASFFDIHINDTAKSWYFNVPQRNRSYVAELGVLEGNKVFYKIARSNVIFVPTDQAATVPSEQISETEQAKREELFKQSGGYIIHKLVGSQVVSQWMAGPSAGASGVSSHVSSGSGGMAFPLKNRSFWAELYTELIVHGATEPSAKVTVGGVPVKLTPDGKFSIRFILNEGNHSVPFVAISKDDIDKIEITPFVNKHTERKDSKIG